jgi:hypothetical protein
MLSLEPHFLDRVRLQVRFYFIRERLAGHQSTTYTKRHYIRYISINLVKNQALRRNRVPTSSNARPTAPPPTRSNRTGSRPGSLEAGDGVGVKAGEGVSGRGVRVGGAFVGVGGKVGEGVLVSVGVADGGARRITSRSPGWMKELSFRLLSW